MEPTTVSILVVDDEPRLLNGIRLALEAGGYRVLVPWTVSKHFPYCESNQ